MLDLQIKNGEFLTITRGYRFRTEKEGSNSMKLIISANRNKKTRAPPILSFY